MPHAQFVRARVTATATQSFNAQISFERVDLQKVAQLMFTLMLRNAASDGFSFIDPNSDVLSLPGCIVAAPSYKGNTNGIDQDYIYNWTRDAAITAMEIAVANIPTAPGGGVETLIDYVNFARICQGNASAAGHFSRASFLVDGELRDWSDQNDGPALQTLAILQAYDQLDAATQVVATTVINNNVNFLVGAYQNPTQNLWEEVFGFSFFARSVILRCFETVKTNTIGIPVPANVDAIIATLQNDLRSHWNGTGYISILAAPGSNLEPEYDPNIDIVSACIYGAVPAIDTRLLATAAQLRSQWAVPGQFFYPINGNDQARGIGPLLGRYPGDKYDGDVANLSAGGHPWAVCTCNFAELYFRLASEIAKPNPVPLDALSAPFFQQVGIDGITAPVDAANKLNDAGESMLQAVIFHSDHLELSEQFDGTNGFEKSVKNLTWSYAAFLSAVRARTGQAVRG